MATERFIDITVRSKGAERNVNSLDKKMKGLGRSSDKTADSTLDLEVALTKANKKILGQSKQLTKLNSISSKNTKQNSKLESTINELTKALDESRQEAAGLSKRLEDLEKKSQKTQSALSKLTKVAKGVAIGISAASVATIAMVKASSNARRETEQLARLVKVSAEEFNALAFATKQYGISAEQIADISKDIADRVGEFSAAGTGTFQDYADVLKLTADEASKTAKEFQFLSGPEVIKRMVAEMEKANIPAAQLTFVLESMGNDLSKLQPLFTNNAAELNRLAGGFRALNSELVITTQQSDELRLVSENFDLMAGTASAASLAISASLAPVLNDLFSDIIKSVPIATQSFIEFINSFKDAENINSIKAIDNQIQLMQVTILELRNSSFLGIDISQTQGTIDAIKRVQDRIGKLVAQRIELQNAPTISAGVAGGPTDGTTGVKEDANQKKIDALFEFFNNERLATEKNLQDLFDVEIGFKTQLEVDEENRFLANQARLRSRFDQGLILIGNDQLAKQDLREEFNIAELAAVAEHEALLTQIQSDGSAKRKQITSDQFLNQLSITASALNSFAQLANKDNKKQQKFQKAAIIANTAVAVVKSFNNGGGYPLGIPPALAMAAAGAAQLKNVGGGTIGSPDTSGGAATLPATTPTPVAQDIPVQQRVIELRTDGSAFSLAVAEGVKSSLESFDEGVSVSIASGLEEAKRIGAI